MVRWGPTLFRVRRVYRTQVEHVCHQLAHQPCQIPRQHPLRQVRRQQQPLVQVARPEGFPRWSHGRHRHPCAPCAGATPRTPSPATIHQQQPTTRSVARAGTDRRLRCCLSKLWARPDRPLLDHARRRAPLARRIAAVAPKLRCGKRPPTDRRRLEPGRCGMRKDPRQCGHAAGGRGPK